MSSDDDVQEVTIDNIEAESDATDDWIKKEPPETDCADPQNNLYVEVKLERIDKPNTLISDATVEDGPSTITSNLDLQNIKGKKRKKKDKNKPGRKVKCDFCHFKSQNVSVLTWHMKNHAGSSAIRANLELQNIKDKKRKKKDKRKPRRIVKCDFCDFKSQSITWHMKNHTGEFMKLTSRKPDVFVCDHCDKKFFLKIHLENHMPVHYRLTAVDPYFTCSVCYYRCISIQELTKHAEFHDKKNRYKCNICDYRFAKEGFLSKHVIRKHLMMGKTKQSACTICDFKTIRPSHLKEHFANHERKQDVKHKCNLCDRKYKHKCHLSRHMKTHGEKTLSCDICNLKFYRAHLLKRHLRTHTGDKPYKCEYCDFKSAQEQNLRRHVRTHTGEKPFKCDACEFRCTQSGDLKRHKLKHTDERPFACDYCVYKSKFRMSLEKHIEKNHYFPDQ